MLQFLANHVWASIIGAVGLVFSALGFASQAHAIATRFKAWQFQALGAALFFVAVIMVLVSYDQGQSSEVQRPIPRVSQSAPETAYVELIAKRGTRLQQQAFLKQHVGETFDLSLKLASMEPSGSVIRGQFYAGGEPNLFVDFSPAWEDYLVRRDAGDTISFRATVLKGPYGYFLGDAKPL
ncbi:hypothetical protein [Pseudoblastomonas halimionae]|uniref:Uncharacterized protein n=1 Tax=Alteriqipengyuania halimionae TaxID=1926630 RepID=A0A6I4U3A1_9SPHN|nr:hypothetical protein [Alteriqipengyuania halimionae]MXP08687.1 hypothetical protein [Alteriqipengyuania halimionae]